MTDSEEDLESIAFRLANAVEQSEFRTAEEIVDTLAVQLPAHIDALPYLAGSVGDVTRTDGDVGSLFPLFETLLDTHLDLAESVFEISAITELEQNFRCATQQLGRSLTDASPEEIRGIREKLEALEKNFAIGIKNIADGNAYDHRAIRVFWGLWRVLDDAIHRIPDEQYAYFAVLLYDIVRCAVLHEEVFLASARAFRER